MRKLFTSILLLTSLISFGQNPAMDDLVKLYKSQDFQSVIEKAKPILEKDPNSIDLNLIMGRSLTDLGEFKNALTYLQFVATNDKDNSWRKAWALSYLGTCNFMSQDYKKSESSLNECIKLNATKNSTNNAYEQTLLFGFNEFYKTWKIIETDNYRFHFQNMSDIEIEKFVSAREKVFSEINDFFKSTLPKKIDFYVWESREDAKNILKTNLGFAKPQFCIVHSHYQQTIGHEITHVVSDFYAKVINKTRLINEGTAVYFDFTYMDRIQAVKNVIEEKNVIIDIDSMWQNNIIEESIFYPIAGAFVEYLIFHGGKDKFLELIKNQTIENAFKIYGDTLSNWITDFEMKFSNDYKNSKAIKQDTIINYQITNINTLDKIIKHQIVEGVLGVNPLILLNGQEYSLEEYEKKKYILSVLEQYSIIKIDLLTSESAKNIKLKKSTSDGVLIVALGDLKKND